MDAKGRFPFTEMSVSYHYQSGKRRVVVAIRIAQTRLVSARAKGRAPVAPQWANHPGQSGFQRGRARIGAISTEERLLRMRLQSCAKLTVQTWSVSSETQFDLGGGRIPSRVNATRARSFPMDSVQSHSLRYWRRLTREFSDCHWRQVPLGAN